MGGISRYYGTSLRSLLIRRYTTLRVWQEDTVPSVSAMSSSTAAHLKVVAPLRFELRNTGSKPDVLPLHYGAMKLVVLLGVEPRTSR